MCKSTEDAKILVFDTTFQGLAGKSFTFFKNDETCPPSKEMLHRAALKGNDRLLKRILDAGIPVDATDEDQTTALMLACRNNHYSCAKILLEHGADPSACRKSGMHSLCYAVLGGYLPIVKLLIEHGANVELNGGHGLPSFFLACRCNHVEIAETILNAKPDSAVKIIHGDPSSLASRNLGDNAEEVPSVKPEKIFETAFPMYLAATHGHVDMIKFLISRGADVNVQRRVPSNYADLHPSLNGITALYVACQFGHTYLVKKLVEWGADVNLGRDDGCTPLFKAAEGGFTEIVKFLLSKGANHGLLKNGETPLHIATFGGYFNVMKVLIEAGANPHIKNAKGLTPLGKAYEGGHSIAIKYLTRIQIADNNTTNNSS